MNRWLRWGFAAVVAAALLGVGFLMAGFVGSNTRHIHRIDMQVAAAKAQQEVGQSYWNNAQPEDASCAHHVEAAKGVTFWCQVILAGELVSVEMELTSSLGYFRVVKVARNQNLLEEGRIEHQAYVEEREAGEQEEARRQLEYEECEEGKGPGGYTGAFFCEAP